MWRIFKRFRPGVLLLGVLICGCKSTTPSPPSATRSVTEGTRNNCYSLLHQLLDEEKDVSKVRFIKRENPDFKDLLKRISAATAAGAVRLEAFAKQDPSLVLIDYGLPAGELKTRDSISSMEQKEVLHSSDDKLELVLLLTQAEALNYGSHLAKVAAAFDLRPERADYLKSLSDEMKRLHDEVVDRLVVQSR